MESEQHLLNCTTLELIRMIQDLKDERDDWKELFFMLKKDHELLENYQTNDWMVKAREMGLEV